MRGEKKIHEASAAQFVAELEKHRSLSDNEKIRRYFQSGDRSRDDDMFMDVRMGRVFWAAKKFIDMTPENIEQLLESSVHEVRLGAVSIMNYQTRNKETAPARRKELFDLYIRRHDRINRWDLVDSSAPNVIGRYLADKPRDVLYHLARSQNQWKRRTAIVSTAHFIRLGEMSDTFALAELLLDDPEDSIHRVTGWMLRFAGDTDRRGLLHFLDQFVTAMPETMRLNAIEHFSEKLKERYLNLKTGSNLGMNFKVRPT